jgi:peptide alpha-N-acetyltransferase
MPIIYRPFESGNTQINLPQFRDINLLSLEIELDLPDILALIEKDLSEPYSVYTYRYFLHQWPHLTILAYDIEEDCPRKMVGVIICKTEIHRTNGANRGYIAMLAVDKEYRHRRIGSTLVRQAIEVMRNPSSINGGGSDNAMTGGLAAGPLWAPVDEVVLETEITNQGAMRLYQRLGFVRDKRLARYYLNGVDAFRLKLWF